MKNCYYLIMLPSKIDITRLNEFLAYGTKLKQAKPHQKLHFIKNVDGTKLIIQGDIDEILENHIIEKTYIIYIGNWQSNGQAEKRVYDYILANPTDWKKEDGVK